MVALACLMQAIAILRATVPALDAVRFVNSARSIDEIGLLGFLDSQSEPPLFPLAIWAFHTAVVASVGEFREAWALSVQLAAALPLIVLPIPVYSLGKRLVGPYVAILGTVLFMCLPQLVRLGADGISDSMHLFWFAVALSLLVSHLLAPDSWGGAVWAVLLAGLATALAFLTRSEAAILAAAFSLVLAIRAWRQRVVPWRSALLYTAGLALVLVPYGLLVTLATGEAGQTASRSTTRPDAPPQRTLRLADGETLSFAPKDPTTSIRRRGMAAALIQLADELPKAFAYAPGLLALVGFWILRRRPRTDADGLLQAFCVLLLAAVVFHTAREGYLAARHLLPLAIAAVACMGLGAHAVGSRIQQLSCRFRSVEFPKQIKEASIPGGDHWRQPAAVGGRFSVPGPAIVLTLVIATLSAIYGVRPVHSSRGGHRAAAGWIAENARRGDRVVDTQGWTGLYSGLTTVPYEKSRTELTVPGIRYLVIEDRELDYDSRRSRTIKWLLEKAGTQVAEFPVSTTGKGTSATVLVYEWNTNGCRE